MSPPSSETVFRRENSFSPEELFLGVYKAKGKRIAKMIDISTKSGSHFSFYYQRPHTPLTTRYATRFQVSAMKKRELVLESYPQLTIGCDFCWQAVSVSL